MPNYISLSHPANKAINFSLREQAAYSEALLRGIAGFQIYGVLVPMLMAGRIQPGDVMLSWMRAAKTKSCAWKDSQLDDLEPCFPLW